eukprot:GHVR01159848.1.p1 GENE.GHVR01159848.1~~GHVR01159848.1.p1  ORF type:complete len:315 (+),score=82.62 GHVR01159848.1:76-1020(+)
MINDDHTWTTLRYCGGGFCSFRCKVMKEDFCRNKYNNTGLCNRSSCPLANSDYGTVLVENGVCYLLLKTVERAHTPKSLWERVKLSRDYTQALAEIDAHMKNAYSCGLLNRCKQRFTRLRQTLMRMRRLRLSVRPTLVVEKRKTEVRDRAREEKAERAAEVDVAIENELLDRLKRGTYGDIYNFPMRNFEAVMNANEEDEETRASRSTRQMVSDTHQGDSDITDIEDTIVHRERGHPDMSVSHRGMSVSRGVSLSSSSSDKHTDNDDDDEIHPHTTTTRLPQRRKKHISSIPRSTRRRVELEYEQEVEDTRHTA